MIVNRIFSIFTDFIREYERWIWELYPSHFQSLLDYYTSSGNHEKGSIARSEAKPLLREGTVHLSAPSRALCLFFHTRASLGKFSLPAAHWIGSHGNKTKQEEESVFHWDASFLPDTDPVQHKAFLSPITIQVQINPSAWLCRWGCSPSPQVSRIP